MDTDGQLPVDERRIPSSIRCLKRYPGISISLEPDPHSGDPEVKIMELPTGTSITPISSKNCQRPSLERIGRQLQVTEGLKCALNPLDSAESNDSTSASNILEFRDDHVGEMHHADAATCAIVTKPFKEFLQRSSLALHHEDRPVKEPFQRPSMGINIGFNHEDKGDLVRAISLARMGGASSMQMVSIGLNTEEPIRLPREDSFAVLANAREELANQSIQKATVAEKCVGIQTDVTMEDLLHQGDDKNAAGFPPKLNSSIPVEARARELTPETWEASHKVKKSNNVVTTSAYEPRGGLSKTELLSQEKQVDGSVDLIVDSVLPMCDTNGDLLPVDLDKHDITHGREFKMQSFDTPASIVINQLMPLNNAIKEREVVLADHKSKNEPQDFLACQFSESSLEVGCTKGPKKEESLLAIPKVGDSTEGFEAMSSSDLIYHHLVVTKLSNRKAHNDERPLVQREAKVFGLTPALLDFLNVQEPKHAEMSKTLSLLSVHHMNIEPYNQNVIKPCVAWTCTSSKGANSMQCPPTDPLSNFQCCLGVLEMSQEVELLWTQIKNRCYLLVLQICLFLFVLFWGGLAEVLVTPPPT
ncbi:hypothetical protein GOP47_0019968 [Adiantum capillus-veneris]|uniref:Uncharacterized protein n=1 Tax=Adiantum capillus-veneris TaxID=13818 RepID=A0A9D4Z7J6_ADICA|nr:hypothetical protein GOP47_0019968 [Adiantum capillus-veneris]